jgi:hypothetical protein
MAGAAFYAIIVPVEGPTATHPIAPGGSPPLGIWGGGGVGDYIDAGFPGPQPGPGRPTHPIYYPPGIWGGPPLYPDIGGPGPQPAPGRPTHPIYYPPTIWPGPRPPYVDAGFPGPQPGGPVHIWGGPYYPPEIWRPTFPTNPIVIPPEELPPQPVPPDKMVVVVFVPGYGYKLVVVPKPPGYNPPSGAATPTPQTPTA